MCWRDPSTGERCDWYHGIWQTLRLLGIVTTLTHHAHLYVGALRPLIAGGKFKRVAIAGAADYGLLAVVLDAFGREGVTPVVTLVDRCATALQLCRWYAERYGHAIETAQCELDVYRDEQTHDLVCAHSLLSCNPAERHAGIVDSWQRLLRPGGILMMVNTLRPDTPGTTVRFSPAEIAAYRKRVADAAASCANPGVLPPAAELGRMAEAFAVRMAASVIGSREQLTGLLEAGGFSLLETRFGDLAEDPAHRRTGPPSFAKKEEAWIVGQRR
jgi:hypothetical protein